jgi:hypothetical protein
MLANYIIQRGLWFLKIWHLEHWIIQPKFYKKIYIRVLGIRETLQIQFGHTIFFLYCLTENKDQIIEIDYIENALSWGLWCSCGYVLDILGKPFKLIQVWTCFELFCVQGCCYPLACALRSHFWFLKFQSFTCVFVLVFLANISNFLILGLDFCEFASELHLVPCIVWLRRFLLFCV